MTPSQMLACFISLALMTCVIIVLALVRDRGKLLTGSYLFIAFMLLGWQLTAVLFVVTDGAVPLSLYDIALPFVALTVMAVLLFTLRLYNLYSRKSLAPVIMLAIIPCITIALALTNPWHEFLRLGIQSSQIRPVVLPMSMRGGWFWIHTGYCYIVSLATFAIALASYRQLPKIYRFSSRMLLLGISASIAGNVLYITQIIPVTLDFSLIGASVSLFFLYFTLHSSQGIETMNMVKDQLPDELDQAIWILDDSSQVVDSNMEARYRQFFSGAPAGEKDFSILRSALFKNVSRIVLDSDKDGSVDYYQEGKIYNLREKSIRDRRGHILGYLAICSDVTEDREIIRLLEDAAGLDALTGLLNIHSIKKQQAGYDTEENLPLAVIMADLNNLKEVNDSLGHQQGDVMLRSAAEALTKAAPPSASVARVGGDEFMVLAPGFSPARAEGLIADIRARLASQRQKRPFEVSLALGYEVKQDLDQPLEDVIRQADKAMYEDKALWHARQNG